MLGCGASGFQPSMVRIIMIAIKILEFNILGFNGNRSIEFTLIVISAQHFHFSISIGIYSHIHDASA